MPLANIYSPAPTIKPSLCPIRIPANAWCNTKRHIVQIYLAQSLCRNRVSWKSRAIYLFLPKKAFWHHSGVFIDDRGIVSCSGDGIVLYTELTILGDNMNYFNCHSTGTTYEVLTVPSERNSFMSCGEDGTVRLYDLRQISRLVFACILFEI